MDEKEKDLETRIIETIVMLLEEQMGTKFEYHEVTDVVDKEQIGMVMLALRTFVFLLCK